MSYPRFLLLKEENGKFNYQLLSSSGEIVLSGNPCNTKISCIENIAAVTVHCIYESRCERQDSGNAYSFTIINQRRDPIAQSKIYPSPDLRNTALIMVQRDAPVALIKDLSIEITTE